MAHALIITKIPHTVGDKIIRGKREKFISAFDIETIELQSSSSDTELVFQVNDEDGKRIYKWSMPSNSSRLSWFADLTEAIEQVTQGTKAPRNRFHIVNTSSTSNKSGTGTLRRYRRKDSKSSKKLSKIFKIPEDELSTSSSSRISENELQESERSSSPRRESLSSSKPEISDAVSRKLVSTRSVPLLPTFPSNSSTPETPSIQSFTSIANTQSSISNTQLSTSSIEKEIQLLQEKVNSLLAEKSEWMRKEQTLNDKIQSLEKQIQDKENIPLKQKSGNVKNVEDVYMQFQNLSQDFNSLVNKFENFEDCLSKGLVEVSAFHSSNNNKKTKKYKK